MCETHKTIFQGWLNGFNKKSAGQRRTQQPNRVSGLLGNTATIKRLCKSGKVLTLNGTESTTGICQALQDLKHEQNDFWLECKAVRVGNVTDHASLNFTSPYGGCTVTSYSRSGRLHVMDDP